MIVQRTFLCPECGRSYTEISSQLDQSRGVIVFSGKCEAGHRIRRETPVANRQELAQLARTGIPRVPYAG